MMKTNTGSEDEEEILQDKEKEELGCLTMASSLIEEITRHNVSQDRESVSTSEDVLDNTDSLNTYSNKNRESEPCEKTEDESSTKFKYKPC